jgi:hypothetical protein
MPTVVNTTRVLGTVSAFPSGTLSWVLADVSLANTDTEITAATIITAAFGAGSGGRIIQACDGGGAALVLSGAATGITIGVRPSSGLGNIQFRSEVTGSTVAAIAVTANYLCQVLVRH